MKEGELEHGQQIMRLLTFNNWESKQTWYEVAAHANHIIFSMERAETESSKNVPRMSREE